jgi:hypothetical protein
LFFFTVLAGQLAYLADTREPCGFRAWRVAAEHESEKQSDYPEKEIEDMKFPGKY